MARTKVITASVAFLIILGIGIAWWTWREKRPERQQQKLVMLHLTDPESAKFSAAAEGTEENVWCGSVNAKNRLGGMAGETRYILEAHLGRLSFDENDAADRDLQKVMSEVTFEGAEGFDSKWLVLCSPKSR